MSTQQNTSPIDVNAINLLMPQPSLSNKRQGYVRNDQWVKQAFIVSTKDLEEIDIRNQTYSSAAFKFTDASLGGNFCINPPAQFTPYADPYDKGIMPGSSDVSVQYNPGHIGMGPYYSEAIDDKSQIIHMSFGTTSYNSLTSFFTGFYSSDAAGLARTGRLDDSFFKRFVSVGVKLVQIALLPITIIPMMINMLGQAIKWLFKIPSSKFAYLKRTMPAYWHAVSSMVNQLSINMGITNFVDTFSTQAIGSTVRSNNANNTIYSAIFPEFTKDGLLDIYAIASKAKVLENRHKKKLIEAMASDSSLAWYGKVKKVMSEDPGLSTPTENEKTGGTLRGVWDLWMSITAMSGKKPDTMVEQDMRYGNEVSEKSVPQAEDILKNKNFQPKNDPAGFFQWFMSAADDGIEYASFRVDYTGAVQESFQNTSAPSALAEKLNSASKSARDLRIDMAGGNIDPLGITKSVIEGAGAVLSGVASILHLEGLAMFAGSALVDIPEHWDSHSAQLPRSSYTIQLVSPYGNRISQLMNIYVPLCMLLAGALPLSTGKQSWQSPFMCELFDRGRCVTKYGMIDSLSISRGTGHLGFNKDGQAMAIDVTFSVKDLSPIIHMPIHQGASLMMLEGLFDSDNKFTEYLVAMSGMSLRENTDRWPILQRQAANVVARAKTYFSPSRIAMTYGSIAGNVLGLFLAGNARGQTPNRGI